MGTHSTVDVKRSTAHNFIRDKIEHVNDETLARLMDVLLDERYLNCLIVPDNFEGWLFAQQGFAGSQGQCPENNQAL